MSQIATVAVDKVTTLLRGGGLQSSVDAIAGQLSIPSPTVADKQVIGHNIAADLLEHGSGGKYPAIIVYCERAVNARHEKGRAFSGPVTMAMEARVSADRLDTVGRDLNVLVDALCDVLENARGDWGDGFFYTGGYEIVFGPVKQGGKHYLQTAKLSLEVQVSRG